MDQESGSRSRTRGRVARLLVVIVVAVGGAYYLLWQFEQISRQIEASYPRPLGETPWPAYWFWTPATVKGEAWKEQAEDLAKRGPFNLVFATPRYPHTGVDFLDTERFLPLFTETKRILRPANIGLGLDLRFYLGARGELPASERQQVVERCDVTVDAEGRGKAALLPTPVLFPAIAAERAAGVLGVYAAANERPRPISAVVAEVEDGVVRVDIGPGPTGRSVSVLVARSFNHPDLFSEAYPRAIRNTIGAYAELRPDALALDEFAFMPLKEDRWRTSLFYSEASAKKFRAQHGAELLDAVANMLLAAESPSRIRDALHYHTHHRCAIVAIEQLFHDEARAKFSFTVGVHPTNQTRANYAELERALTFLDWWSVPREDGQTDEETPMAVRMGLALKAGGRVWYNMYYDPDREKILDEVARCARFGGRVHFHAYGDAHYGYPLEKGDFLERLTAVKKRMKVLDREVRGVPELDTLVVLGWPAIMLGEGPTYGNAMRFLNQLWARGYRAAAVPTYEIAGGNLGVVDGLATYGGRSFRRVIVYHPEYATPTTTAWLAALLHAREAEIKVVGKLTIAADGTPQPFGKKLARVTVTEAALLAEKGPALGEVGVRFPGNLRVLVDRKSLADGSIATRTFTVDGTPFTVEFTAAAVVEVAPGTPPRLLE